MALRPWVCPGLPLSELGSPYKPCRDGRHTPVGGPRSWLAGQVWPLVRRYSPLRTLAGPGPTDARDPGSRLTWVGAPFALCPAEEAPRQGTASFRPGVQGAPAASSFAS